MTKTGYPADGHPFFVFGMYDAALNQNDRPVPLKDAAKIRWDISVRQDHKPALTNWQSAFSRGSKIILQGNRTILVMIRFKRLTYSQLLTTSHKLPDANNRTKKTRAGKPAKHHS
ncbi:MAG: hypothetical protein LAT75_12735 [Candidatus Cyclonatronum sp.]|uniref:hypothetical protein n=1 Tax=Cyclonatronum sp. TaxID=3024185 RepID=UPI0025BC8410|nr:hypothetical protein [Cyclonatronum sp.]MCH8487727.1 hypothetical protein [Cyclonatronum sp.]